MQDLQNDINSLSDPYRTGIGYGRRFCIRMGAAVAFALGARRGRTRGRSGPGGSEPAGSSPLASPLDRSWLLSKGIPREFAVGIRPGIMD